jgi:hypothetical protein
MQQLHVPKTRKEVQMKQAYCTESCKVAQILSVILGATKSTEASCIPSRRNESGMTMQTNCKTNEHCNIQDQDHPNEPEEQQTLTGNQHHKPKHRKNQNRHQRPHQILATPTQQIEAAEHHHHSQRSLSPVEKAADQNKDHATSRYQETVVFLATTLEKLLESDPKPQI